MNRIKSFLSSICFSGRLTDITFSNPGVRRKETDELIFALSGPEDNTDVVSKAAAIGQRR